MTIMMDIELNHLTEEERDRILNVLRKDEELKVKDAERIRKLKIDLKRIRLRGVIKAGMDPDKTCARCRESFGWIFNKGAVCPQCQHKVCENCREKLVRDPNQWLCILCHKQMELDAMSGQWFLQKFRRSKRSKRTNKVITGQEMVKASIRRHPQTGAHGPDSSRTGPNAEEARKVSSNNNSSPKSSRSVGSNVEESSDTQSTASTSPGRKRPDIHDMGFPKESDKQRLFDLIRSKAPVIGKEEIEKPTVEVRKVSLSRYRSDSESSSSSGPSSPQLSTRTESEFRYSDSIRSSIRSVVSGVSAISSEGRMTMVTETNISDIDSTSFASLQSSSSNLNSPRQSCSSLEKPHMYDREHKQNKSSDSVIENPAHRQPEFKLTTVRTDTSDGPIILEDTEVTVRKVRTSKHVDSMSSDSDAEDTTTEQVSKGKFRRISAGRSPGGRSRSPSPDPRSRSRPNDFAANTMQSPESVSNKPEIEKVVIVGGAARRDGQAGGVTNSPMGVASRSRENLSHSPNLAENCAQANNDSLQQNNAPDSETETNGSHVQQGNNHSNHSVRDKVSFLLAKYRRNDLSQASREGRADGADKANGEGAIASTDFSDKHSDSDSGSVSSYDIIEMDKTTPQEQELEWDSDMLDHGNQLNNDWDQIRAAVNNNTSKHHNDHTNASDVSSEHSSECKFLDDEPEDGEYYINHSYDETVNIWAKTHCRDYESDSLSVITEHTEPDDDRDDKARSPYAHLDLIKSNAIDHDDRDFGYFTLPDKEAVSRTESMRSAREGELSPKSLSPSSDNDYVIIDSDLSMISEISGTESTQGALSPDLKQSSYAYYNQDSLDDLVAPIMKDKSVITMDIDDVFRNNLPFLDENDLKHLDLPLNVSAERPPAKPLRERKMGKSVSEGALLMQKALKEEGGNAGLQKRRENLRSVHGRSNSVKEEKKGSAEIDEKPVDESHTASISDLTKMFDKPPPYYNARVTVNTEPQIMSGEIVQVMESITTNSIEERVSSETKVSCDNLTAENDITDGGSDKQSSLLKEPYPNSTEILSANLVGEHDHIERVEVIEYTMTKKEREAKKKEEKKRRKEEKKSKGKKASQKHTSIDIGHDLKEEADVTDFKEGQPNANKRSPSPTVRAVQEKVEVSKSTPLREIICAELEREVLEDVTEMVAEDNNHKENNAPLTDLTVIETKAKSPGRQWIVEASPVEEEVERQLEAWKKKRELHRNRPSASSVEGHSGVPILKSEYLEPNESADPQVSTPTDQRQQIVLHSQLSEIVPDQESKESDATQVSDSASGSGSLPERNFETGNTSDELEEAFLRPRVPTPGGELDERSHNRPHHHYIVTEDSGELLYVDTESTLTPDPDLDDSRESTLHEDFVAPVIHLQGASSETDEDEEEEDKLTYHSRKLHPRVSYENDDEYEDGEGLSYSTGTTGSIGRSSYDGNSMVGALSVDTQESASLRSSIHSSQNSPGSGSYGSGEGDACIVRWSQRNLLKGVCVSYDSLDVLVDEESDTAEERMNPAMVEEDVTLSLDLGPRPEPYASASRKAAGAWVHRNRSGGGAADADCGDVGASGAYGGGSDVSRGGGEIRNNSRFKTSSNKPTLSSSKSNTPSQSVPSPVNRQPDTKQSNGHSPGSRMDSRYETSSLTESETGSTSERSSHREHKSSISSVPSINVTHHDNENKSQDSPVFERRTPVQSPVEPPGSSVEESDEVDDIIIKHTSPTHSMHSQKSSSLLSPFSGSKESIVSFYSDAGEGNYGNIPITGDILFGLEYNYKTGSLEVKIKQCRDLAPVDTKKKRSDPYVKVYLLPDKTKSGKRKTRVKKHTLNPVFDEVLKYAITKSELETRTLWVTVWHSDMFGRNDFLGEVTIPLDYYAFDESSPQWYKLQERNASPMSLLTYKGDLMISLKYVTADNASTNKIRAGNKKRTGKGELHVLVKEARNLTAVRANGFSDPFCKGYLLPDKTRSMKQKTPVAKRDCNPQWNHTLVFEDLTLEDLKDRSLELTVWDHDRFTSNDFLGGLRLNLGTGKIQGKDVDWMDSRGEEVSMWQSMLDRPNCWIDGSLMLRPNMGRRK